MELGGVVLQPTSNSVSMFACLSKRTTTITITILSLLVFGQGITSSLVAINDSTGVAKVCPIRKNKNVSAVCSV